jgi:hypothetical protein
VQFCELLWDPLCTDFMEGVPVLDTFKGWTTTNLQLMCHFINSHLSVLQDHAIDSFHVCISDGCGFASSSFPMLNTSVTIFEPLDPFTQSVVTRHCSHTALTFYAFWHLVHLQPTKMDHCPLLFFGANEIGVSMFVSQNSWHKWTIKVTPAPQW